MKDTALKPNLLFVGSKGSGKTTQIELLKEKYSYQVLSIGVELRKLAEKDVELKKLVSSGLPVSKLHIQKAMNDFMFLNKGKEIIIDGSPYDVEQLIIYNQFISDNNLDITIVELHVVEKELMRRLDKRKRIDSGKNKELIKKYQENVFSLHGEIIHKDFLKINGNHTIKEVFEDVQNKLGF
jgi:adenylate kinase family enzyme